MAQQIDIWLLGLVVWANTLYTTTHSVMLYP